MKRLFLLLITTFTLSYSSVIAQEQGEQKQSRHQFSIGHLSIFNLSNLSSQGVTYKYKFKTGALRIGTTYDQDYSRESRGNWDDEDKMFEIEPNLGYEFYLTEGDIILYSGLDLKYRYAQQTRISTDWGSLTNLFKREESGYGLSPFFGVRFQVHKHFSISTETNLSIMYAESRQTNFGRIDSERYMRSSLSPLGLITLDLHF